MAKDIIADEYVTGSDVVEKIERIGSLATLGNWAKEMERSGHKFQHDGRGRRIYSEEDMEILAKMNELLGDRHTLKQAVQATLGMNDNSSKDGEDTDEVTGSENTPAVIDESMKRFIASQSKDMADLKELLTKVLKQNQSYHEENVKLEQKIDELAEKNQKILDQPKQGWWKRHFG
ncbi:MerR family transcriptional regulator [Pediococcus pentosaceus]|uniref:MerR family transcriptional regulator n=1 Tax=Pediococcus pentosaceus TaxID=1255 RepID=UPI003F28F07C